MLCLGKGKGGWGFCRTALNPILPLSWADCSLSQRRLPCSFPTFWWALEGREALWPGRGEGSAEGGYSAFLPSRDGPPSAAWGVLTGEVRAPLKSILSPEVSFRDEDSPELSTKRGCRPQEKGQVPGLAHGGLAVPAGCGSP